MALLRRREGSRHPAPREREPGMLSLRDEMNRLLDDFVGGWGFDRPLGNAASPMTMGRFVPAVDVSDTDSEIRVSAELPGMTEDDINVELDDDVLTISGEKKQEEEEEKEGHYWRESSYGHFMREIRLPAGVETDKAQATYSNGRLQVSLPKSEESRARRRSVEIRSS
jgi:HSP20 family protein